MEFKILVLFFAVVLGMFFYKNLLSWKLLKFRSFFPWKLFKILLIYFHGHF